MEDQKLWSMAECATVMDKAVNELKELFASEVKKKGEEEGFLVWDKDDLPALNFVTACANIRMHIFNISTKSRFEVKSMAGNIIPATVSQQQFQPRMQITHDFIFDKLICYSYVQEYVIE